MLSKYLELTDYLQVCVEMHRVMRTTRGAACKTEFYGALGLGLRMSAARIGQLEGRSKTDSARCTIY